MSIKEDILKLLKSEGYIINEVVRDSLDDFVDTCEAELDDPDNENNDDEDEQDD